tara:strand:- start:1985 stop:2146 length:162 start_codon:yes stop_codon:yes gene_type:complete
MSREDPLEPLYKQMDKENLKKEQFKKYARIGVSWFVGFMLTASLIRYMVRYVQ